MWLAIAIQVVSGCDPSGKKSTENSRAVASTRPSSLKMLVVDDSELAKETGRRWAAEGQFELIVETCTAQEIRDKKFVVDANVDLLVMPAALEPEFVAADQLVEIPVHSLESPEFSQGGLLAHFRGNLATLDERQYSLPLGAPQAMLLIHESLAKLEGFSPLTWESVKQSLANVDEDKRKIVYPDAGDWLAWSLLARAASTVRASNDRSVMFVIETLEPLIDSPGFIDALEKMQAEAAALNPDAPRTPNDVFRMVAEGKALAGLGWPNPLGNTGSSGDSIAGVYPWRLPGSVRRYSRKQSAWFERKPTEQSRFDLFGIDGRCVGVTTASLHAGTSMELAIWMSNKFSNELCTQSVASGPFRKTHLVKPNLWIGMPVLPDAAEQWASEIEASHAALLPVVFPPLAGRDEYLAVLASGVRKCLVNEKSAEEALHETSTEWASITEKHGVDVQKTRIRWRRP